MRSYSYHDMPNLLFGAPEVRPPILAPDAVTRASSSGSIEPEKFGYDIRWNHVLNKKGRVVRTRIFHKTEGFWGESPYVPQLDCSPATAERRMQKIKFQYFEEIKFHLINTPYRWNLMGTYAGPLTEKEPEQ
jgi:hypothetical protein